MRPARPGCRALQGHQGHQRVKLFTENSRLCGLPLQPEARLTDDPEVAAMGVRYSHAGSSHRHHRV